MHKQKGPDLSQRSVRECIEQIHIASRDIGFLGLTGHNISRQLRLETLELSRQFFSLHQDEKNEMHISKYNNCIGYQRFGDNVTLNKRDKHEGIDYFQPTNDPIHYPFNIGQRPYPSTPSSFSSVFNEYTKECLKFGELIMSAMALSLRLPFDYFNDKCNDSFYCLRIIHYPSENEESNNNEEFGVWGCGEHRDYGCLTFINCDTTTDCLEVQDANGVYGKVNVNTIDEDCFIVNLGDMVRYILCLRADLLINNDVCIKQQQLNVWSGGLYQSTPHRVLPPKLMNICNGSREFNKRWNTEIGRISVPFFYEPNWDTIIKPIELNINEDFHEMGWNMEDKLKWEFMKDFRENCEGIMYGDHLKSKVLSNFA